MSDQVRIRTRDELDALREKLLAREDGGRRRVLVCMTGCRARGADKIASALRDGVQSAGLSEQVDVVDVGCHGQCSRAPLVLIEPEGFMYGNLKPKDIGEIVETTLKDGNPVDRLCVNLESGPAPRAEDVPFYAAQQRDVLKNCGRIDPRDIEAAIAVGGYGAAAKALAMEPEKIISIVQESELRGRGGAGFPTGTKWAFARRAPGDEKYLVCNADEGDPGAFMDRALLEGTPHQVIEGMLIAAFAIGAREGFIYVRAEYPIAVEHVNLAVKQAREYGLLGDDILGSGFDFDITVRKGSGAFVCGEETALIASLEGDRGTPRPRPPYPANAGFRDKPTNINNVETLANIPLIVGGGAEAFKSKGTAGGRGTKIFALAGDVAETGLVEVPLGATLRDIVFGVGGGIPDGRSFKAAQIGGPSGGCLPAEHLDLPIDYETVKEVGAIMGSGGLVVMDDRTCMVDVARFFLEFTQKESCGKCVPCRVGTRHLADILKRICEGKGERSDIGRLERLAQDTKEGSLCGLGQTAANPVLTTLRYFRDEYEAHIIEKRCPAGVCRDLISYFIEADKCTGCGRCRKACPVSVISGEKKLPHLIDASGCTRCGSCKEVCPEDAVLVIPRYAS